MPADVIEISAPQELETKALSIPEQAKQIHVADQPSYERAATFLRDVVAPMRREIADTFDPICKRTNEAHKEATAQRARHLKPVDEAERFLKSAIGAYELGQQRIAAEAARREREEQERIAAEQLEAEIEAAKSAGATAAEVRAIVETPVALPKPVVSQTFTKAAGVSTRKTYKARVVDVRALCRAVAEGRIPTNYVLPNEVALNAAARSQGAEIARFVPGVVAEEVASVATRRAR